MKWTQLHRWFWHFPYQFAALPKSPACPCCSNQYTYVDIYTADFNISSQHYLWEKIGYQKYRDIAAKLYHELQIVFSAIFEFQNLFFQIIIFWDKLANDQPCKTPLSFDKLRLLNMLLVRANFCPNLSPHFRIDILYLPKQM